MTFRLLFTNLMNFAPPTGWWTSAMRKVISSRMSSRTGTKSQTFWRLGYTVAIHPCFLPTSSPMRPFTQYRWTKSMQKLRGPFRNMRELHNGVRFVWTRLGIRKVTSRKMGHMISFWSTTWRISMFKTFNFLKSMKLSKKGQLSWQTIFFILELLTTWHYFRRRRIMIVLCTTHTWSIRIMRMPSWSPQKNDEAIHANSWPK